MTGESRTPTVRRASADEYVIGRDDSRPITIVDKRGRHLETVCAEPGARLAALEELVFLLQERVRELETGAWEQNRTRIH